MDKDTIKALIQKYRSEADLLQGMARRLEADYLGQNGGRPDEPESAANSGSETPRKPKVSQQGDPLALISEWAFFNKTQAEAAEQFLEMVGHPLDISTLVEGLEKGGLKIGGASAVDKRQNLGTILLRSGRLGRIGRGTWGLPSWPNITPAKIKEKQNDSPTDPSGNEQKDEKKKETASE